MNELITLAQRLAGQSAFEKGVQIHQSKQVVSLTFDSKSVQGQVQGTHLYQVDLVKVAESFDGGCSCPASEGFDFCKHCVAIVLEYSERLEEYEKKLDGPPAARLLAHLEQLPAEEIKEELYRLIKESPVLFEHWVLVADVSSGKVQVRELKQHFTRALPLRDIWRHDKVRNYFDKALQTLSRLFTVVELIHPQQRFDLCEFTLQRYDKILERVDDSGGYRLGVFTLLEKQLAKSFQLLTWDNQGKSDYLVALYHAPYNHLSFEEIPRKFIAVDDAGLKQSFHVTLKKHIDNQLGERERSKTSETLVLKQMVKQLISYYQSNGRVKPALFYWTQVASNLDEYFEIIERSIASTEYQIAHEYIQIANKNIRMHEDKTKLDRHALTLSIQTEKYDDALAYAWAIFEATLKTEDYKYLESLWHKQEHDKSKLNEKAEKILLAQVKVIRTKKHSSSALRAIENLVEFYLYNDQIDKALSLSTQYELAPDTMQEVGFASLTKRPKASFNIYRQLCLLYPQLGGHKDYETCIDLLHELDNGLQRDDLMSEKFNHLLAELADIFRHKEPFILLLNRAFPNTRS